MAADRAAGAPAAQSADQHLARLAEEAAERVLSDAIAALRLSSFEAQALAAAADSYAKARAARLVAERGGSV